MKDELVIDRVWALNFPQASLLNGTEKLGPNTKFKKDLKKA